MLSTIVFAVGALASPIYPYDQVWTRNCQTKGHLQVCEINRGNSNPRLEVTYFADGSLWPKASPINLFVTVNNKPGQRLGPMGYIKIDGKEGAQYTINKLKASYKCYQASTGDAPDYVPAGALRCPVTNDFPLIPRPGRGEYVYYYERSPANEEALLEGFSWDVQLSFVNEKGDWDSNSANANQNYRFMFQ